MSALECPNDEHRLNTCHQCVGSGVVEGFDQVEPCSRCNGRGHLHQDEEMRRLHTDPLTWAIAAATLNDHADVWEADGSDPCRVRICREMANVFRTYAEGVGIPSHQTMREKRDEARAERDKRQAALDRVLELIDAYPRADSLVSVARVRQAITGMKP